MIEQARREGEDNCPITSTHHQELSAPHGGHDDKKKEEGAFLQAGAGEESMPGRTEREYNKSRCGTLPQQQLCSCSNSEKRRLDEETGAGQELRDSRLEEPQQVIAEVEPSHQRNQRRELVVRRSLLFTKGGTEALNGSRSQCCPEDEKDERKNGSGEAEGLMPEKQGIGENISSMQAPPSSPGFLVLNYGDLRSMTVSIASMPTSDTERLPSRPGAFASNSLPHLHRPSPRPLQENHSDDDDRHTSSCDGSDPTNDPESMNRRSALAEAEPIIEFDLEHAQPVVTQVDSDEGQHDDGGNKTARPGLLMVGSLMAVTVVAIALALLVLLVGVFRDEGNTENLALAHPEVTREDFLREILPGYSPVSETSAGNVTPSSQQLAFDWMLQDPMLLQGYNRERLLQRYALATLYFATNGALWTRNHRWLNYSYHECDWFTGGPFKAWYDDETPASPCGKDGSYERLRLQNNTLNGTLPDEIYLLSSLQSIDFFSNGYLTGTISTKIGQLRSLTKLSTINCQMSGTIPSQVGLLSHLRILYLEGADDAKEKLHGTLPQELATLDSLEQLNINHNAFHGPLPAEFAASTKLLVFKLSGNQFTGTLPQEWAKLSELIHFKVSANHLTGTIPTQYGLLKSVQTFHAFSNRLSGTLPTELGHASTLTEIVLANNTLVGTLPSELGRLTSLYMFFLSQNTLLSGTLPTEFQKLTKIEAFDISETNIAGRIPPRLQRAQNDTSFNRFVSECNWRFPCP